MPPKYLQLSETLAHRIDQGEWTVGDRLPSEVILAKEYGVAYMTVRSAISELVEKGKLRRIRGRGTFVVEPANPGTLPTLGLLLPPRWHSLDPFYFPHIVAGFTERAEELGYRVHLGDRSEPLIEFIQLRELHVSAVACVMVGEGDVLEAESLLDRGVVVVAINHYRGTRRIAAVSPDNQGGSYAAMRALLHLGHREFAYLAGPESNLDAQQRLLGARRALRDFGLSKRSLTTLPGGFNEESGYERTKALVDGRKLPTAILTASDLSAFGAIKALADHGIRVPDDVSVVGFGDFRPSAYLNPALSTVHLPLHEVGRRASETLVEAASGKRAGESILLDSPVVSRESMGAPRPSARSRPES